MKLAERRETNCPKQWWSALARNRSPAHQLMFLDLPGSSKLLFQNLGGGGCPHPAQAGVPICWLHHGRLMAKAEGPGMPVFEPHPSSWLPRENCQWGVPGHKKWSFSWELDYFTWKTQASFLPAGIFQLYRTYCSPEWRWLYPLALEFRDSAPGHYCCLCSSLLPISPEQPSLLELIVYAYNSESNLWDKYLSTCLLPVKQLNVTAVIHSTYLTESSEPFPMIDSNPSPKLWAVRSINTIPLNV